MTVNDQEEQMSDMQAEQEMPQPGSEPGTPVTVRTETETSYSPPIGHPGPARKWSGSREERDKAAREAARRQLEARS